ncbi:hypothetical protein [Gangjinia marincola]
MRKLIFSLLLFFKLSAFAQPSGTAVADSLFAVGNYTKAITVYQSSANF